MTSLLLEGDRIQARGLQAVGLTRRPLLVPIPGFRIYYGSILHSRGIGSPSRHTAGAAASMGIRPESS